MDIKAELGLTNLSLIANNEGLNSEVYKGWDPQLGIDVVVKQVPKTKFSDFQAYHQEAQMLYDARHPNVARVLYGCQDNSNIHLVMPFYPRGSLASIMKNQGALTVREVISYSLDFLTGLHHIHTKGLIHYDIKPTNLLVDNSGKTLLTDFGLSRYVNNQGVAVQTDPVYQFHMAPEQLQYSMHTQAVDVYQAGATIYRLCNGLWSLKAQFHSLAKGQQLLFTGTDQHFTILHQAIVAGSFPDRNRFLPHIPNSLRKVVKKAIHVNPDKRYGSVLDLMNALAKVKEHLDVLFEVDFNSGKWKWTIDRGSSVETILMSTGNKCEVKTTKLTKKSGNTFNVHAKTKQQLTMKQALDFVRNIL